MQSLTGDVIGAAIEVHKVLGSGYLESVYEAALAVEMQLRGLAFARQYVIPLAYKGHSIGEGRLDFLVQNQLVVELKAVDALVPVHTAQVISYLRATRTKLALLISFNVPVLKSGIRRIILD
jgi:GxxExxY protein